LRGGVTVTGPLRPDAELVAKLTVDSSDVPSEVKDALDRASRSNDADLKRTGREMSDAVADGMDDQFGRRIPDIFDGIEQDFGKRKLKADVDFEVDEGLIPDELERVFSRVARPGGPIDRFSDQLGQAVSSGIGAGFNVSGRGPLLFLLLPVIGAIGALIAGLVQIVNGLTAVLFTIPSLLGAIALQGGVLFLVFQGLGESITAAFAAKTPKEFEKAIEGLAPPVQEFIRSLLPLRELFKDLKDLAQRNFFAAFGGILANFAQFMRFNLVLAVDKLSTAFGELFRSLISFFGNPRFQEFFTGLIDSTEKWLQALSPALTQLLVGFTELGIAVKPFFDWFGAGVNKGIEQFGKFLENLSADPEFTKWLDDMKETLRLTWDILQSLISVTKEFFKTLDEAGGNKILEQLIYLFGEIEYFLESDIGKRGLQTLLGILLALTYLFVIMVGGFLSFLGIIHMFVDWLVNDAGPRIKKFFTEDIPGWIEDLIDLLTIDGTEIRGALSRPFEEARTAIINAFNNAVAFIQSVPGRIQGFFASSGTWLIEAGRNIIGGLIQGIRDKLGPLGFILDVAAAAVGARFPKSPAEIGPLSGSGDPLFAGQKIIQRLAAGIQMETPALEAAASQAAGSIIFGPGSVRVGFEGAVPTPEQAQTTGVAAGRGIVNALALRNTRLQVRTL